MEISPRPQKPGAYGARVLLPAMAACIALAGLAFLVTKTETGESRTTAKAKEAPPAPAPPPPETPPATAAALSPPPAPAEAGVPKITRSPADFMKHHAGTPSTAQEEKRRIEEEAERGDPVELAAGLEFTDLSFPHVQTKRMVSSTHPNPLTDLELDPRIAKILTAGLAMRENDPGGHRLLLDTLRDGLRRYINDFPDTSPDQNTSSVQNPRAAVAWPYLLAKLGGDPGDILLITGAEARMREGLEEQMRVLAGQDRKLMAEGKGISAVEGIDEMEANGHYAMDSEFRRSLAYAASTFMDGYAGDAALQAGLSEGAKAVLEEYARYQGEHLQRVEATASMMADWVRKNENTIVPPEELEKLKGELEWREHSLLPQTQVEFDFQQIERPPIASREIIVLEYARAFAGALDGKDAP